MNKPQTGEVCANCGDKIGNMETPQIYHGQVVCGMCDKKLRAQASSEPVDTKTPPGETTLYTCGHHWVFFLRPRVIILSICTVGIALIYYILKFRSTNFTVTNKRVTKNWGIIARDSWEIMLRQVSGVNVKRGLLDRIVGTGQIEVVGAGGVVEIFLAVKHPKQFRQAVIDAMPA